MNSVSTVGACWVFWRHGGVGAESSVVDGVEPNSKAGVLLTSARQ